MRRHRSDDSLIAISVLAAAVVMAFAVLVAATAYLEASTAVCAPSCDCQESAP